jgi:hypothetical protein
MAIDSTPSQVAEGSLLDSTRSARSNFLECEFIEGVFALRGRQHRKPVLA